MDVLTKGWLSSITRAMSLIQHRSLQDGQSTDCLVISSASLISAYANLLTYGLSGALGIEGVFSSFKNGEASETIISYSIDRMACLERIASRFSRKTIFIMVGNSPCDKEAATQVNVLLVDFQ